MLARAMALVRTEFGHKRRKGNGAPYEVHLFSCLGIVTSYGGEEVIQTAALLHDIVEDAGMLLSEIEQEFGSEVRGIVAAVTEDKNLPWRERKESVVELARTCCQVIGTVLLADKIDNFQSFVRDTSQLSQEERATYWKRFNAGLAEQVWFGTSLAFAFQANPKIVGNPKYPGLRTRAALSELCLVVGLLAATL